MGAIRELGIRVDVCVDVWYSSLLHLCLHGLLQSSNSLQLTVVSAAEVEAEDVGVNADTAAGADSSCSSFVSAALPTPCRAPLDLCNTSTPSTPFRPWTCPAIGRLFKSVPTGGGVWCFSVCCCYCCCRCCCWCFLTRRLIFSTTACVRSTIILKWVGSSMLNLQSSIGHQRAQRQINLDKAWGALQYDKPANNICISVCRLAEAWA